jgi:hypothetical protein
MHFSWFTGLSYKVPFFGIYFLGGRKAPFHILLFQGTSRHAGPKNNWSVFHREKDRVPKKHARGATRTKRAQVARPTLLGAPRWPIWASSLASAPPFYRCLCLTRKPKPYFPKIYWGGGGGESPLLIRERADPAWLSMMTCLWLLFLWILWVGMDLTSRRYMI